MARLKKVFTKEALERVEELASKGLSELNIAKSLNMGYSTFRREKEKSEQLRTALEKGKADGMLNNNAVVERSLFSRCTGRFVEEITTDTEVYDGKTKVKRKVVKKFIQPSDTAIIFYLCNRYPEKWKSIQNVVTVINNKGLEDDLSFLTDEELEELDRMMKSRSK